MSDRIPTVYPRHTNTFGESNERSRKRKYTQFHNCRKKTPIYRLLLQHLSSLTPWDSRNTSRMPERQCRYASVMTSQSSRSAQGCLPTDATTSGNLPGTDVQILFTRFAKPCRILFSTLSNAQKGRRAGIQTTPDASFFSLLLLPVIYSKHTPQVLACQKSSNQKYFLP